MTPGDKENWIRGGEHDLENGLSTPLLNVAPKAHFVCGKVGLRLAIQIGMALAIDGLVEVMKNQRIKGKRYSACLHKISMM